MRTALIILGGIVLFGVCAGIARLVSDTGRPTGTIATIVFIAAWLVIAAANLVVGVTQAGYSWREEFPIFVVIFLVPVAVAWLVHRYLLS
ncbi:MAG: hypothetical protein ABI585_04200 [Betaproteobacteria bacterium]